MRVCIERERERYMYLHIHIDVYSLFGPGPPRELASEWKGGIRSAQVRAYDDRALC